VEWTVPYRRSILHLGIHNLPPASARSWMRVLADFTSSPDERRLPEILSELDRIAETLIVLNHPFWLEEGVRQITALPAALCGFNERGLLLPGYAADVYIFDPDTIGPAHKEFVHDFPNEAGRWTSKPNGAYATIVNGVPIVLDGELQVDAGLPGKVLRPNS